MKKVDPELFRLPTPISGRAYQAGEDYTYTASLERKPRIPPGVYSDVAPIEERAPGAVRYGEAFALRKAPDDDPDDDLIVFCHPDTAKALWPEHAAEIDRVLNEGWGLFGFGGPVP